MANLRRRERSTNLLRGDEDAAVAGGDTDANFGLGFQHWKMFFKMSKKRQLRSANDRAKGPIP